MSEEKEPQLSFLKFNFPNCDQSNGMWFLDSRYRPIKALGKGAFGQVMSCLDTKTDKKVAIKRILNTFNQWEDGIGEIREIKAMMHCKHPKVIALETLLIPYRQTSSGEVVYDPDFDDVYMVMPSKPMNINKLLESGLPLNKDHISFVMFQLLEGMAYLHASGIVHRDLKPENILVDEKVQITIIDLGLAREMDEDTLTVPSEYVMTRWYRAPEILCPNASPERYGVLVDMWSCGCLFAELMLKDAMFPGKQEAEMIDMIAKAVPDPTNFIAEYTEHLTPEVKATDIGDYFEDEGITLTADEKDLMGKLLCMDPKNRISAAQALEHPLFARWQAHASQSLPATKFSFQKPQQPLDIDDEGPILRDLVWKCIQTYNPEMPNRDAV